jgi:signal peptidase II
LRDAAVPGMMRPMVRRALLTLGLASAVLAADQTSKLWALSSLRFKRAIEVVPGCFHLAYAENRSAAFGILGILPFELRRYVLTAFAGIAIVVLLFLVVTGRIRRSWTAAATGLILGGAIGNVIDRMRLGYVVDFIDWHVGDHYHWPTFNVADSGIVVGVFMLLWLSYVVDRQAARGKAHAPAPAK